MERLIALKQAFFACLFLLVSCAGAAAPLNVAVASNFYASLRALVNLYTQNTGKEIAVSAGSSGVLFAQIKRGAPFDIFLSADRLRPRLLEQSALTVYRATYAVGLLVLWSPNRELLTITDITGVSGKIAIANPDLAPYGVAASEVILRLNSESMQQNLVFGNNVNQVFQFVDTGNAVAGFLSQAQVTNRDGWLPIPSSYYSPIEQQLVILDRTKQLQEAQKFVDFLLSDSTQTFIRQQGYGAIRKNDEVNLK